MILSAAVSRCPVFLVGLAWMGAVGCGPSTGTLTGKVTYNGKTLAGGNVTLVPDGKGQTFSATIAEDGTYTFANVRSGKYKVCVETASLNPSSSQQGPNYGGRPLGNNNAIKNQPPPGAELPEGYMMSQPPGAAAADAAKRYVAIPAQYADPSSTPLTVEVTGGAQTHDISLS